MISLFTRSYSPLTFERNYRVITDPTTIEYKLNKQFLIAQLHKNDKASVSRNFEYSTPKTSYADLPDKTELYTVQNLRVFNGLSCTVEAALFLGAKEIQEDAFIASSFEVTTPSGQKHTVLLTGIFDGHTGDQAALFMKDNLKEKLKITFAALFNKTLEEEHPLKALHNEKALSDVVIWNVLKIICVELHDEYPGDCEGTTAAFSLLIDGKDLWHANLGDSRSIVASEEKTIQLSEDMKLRFNFPPDMSEDAFKELELARLEKSNPGYALKNHFERSIWKRGGFCIRGFSSTEPRLNGAIAMARSIGDKKLEKGLCPRPKIVKIRLDEHFPNSNSCLLLHASDGLWDIVTTDQVAIAINSDKHSSLADIAANLARSAIECDDFDNTSVVLTKIDLRALRELRS